MITCNISSISSMTWSAVWGGESPPMEPCATNWCMSILALRSSSSDRDTPPSSLSWKEDELDELNYFPTNEVFSFWRWTSTEEEHKVRVVLKRELSAWLIDMRSEMNFWGIPGNAKKVTYFVEMELEFSLTITVPRWLPANASKQRLRKLD